MTTIYVPRLIETAEQAEALPIGTVSTDFDSQGQPRQASIRVRGGWYCTGEVEADGSPWLAPHDVMAGDYALVPIEAEEETSVVVGAAGFQDIATHPYSEASMDSDGNAWFGEGLDRVDVTEEFNEWAKQHTRTRYVTPWEDV